MFLIFYPKPHLKQITPPNVILPKRTIKDFELLSFYYDINVKNITRFKVIDTKKLFLNSKENKI